jgi:hypothetical protein
MRFDQSDKDCGRYTIYERLSSKAETPCCKNAHDGLQKLGKSEPYMGQNTAAIRQGDCECFPLLLVYIIGVSSEVPLTRALMCTCRNRIPKRYKEKLSYPPQSQDHKPTKSAARNMILLISNKNALGAILIGCVMLALSALIPARKKQRQVSNPA